MRVYIHVTHVCTSRNTSVSSGQWEISCQTLPTVSLNSAALESK